MERLKRYEYLKALGKYVNDDDIVITNVGGVTLEWNSIKDKDSNLYIWHSLGLASSIGLGMAIASPDRRVFVLDGDGSILLNLGSLTTIGNQNPTNLIHIVFDNEAYEAPGGLPTATAGNAKLNEIAEGCGIINSFEVNSIEEFEAIIKDASLITGPWFICVKVEKGTAEVPYIRSDALESKYRFIRWMEKDKGIEIIKAPGHVTRLRGK